MHTYKFYLDDYPQCSLPGIVVGVCHCVNVDSFEQLVQPLIKPSMMCGFVLLCTVLDGFVEHQTALYNVVQLIPFNTICAVVYSSSNVKQSPQPCIDN